MIVLIILGMEGINRWYTQSSSGFQAFNSQHEGMMAVNNIQIQLW